MAWRDGTLNLRVLLGSLACDCFLSLFGRLEGFGHVGEKYEFERGR